MLSEFQSNKFLYNELANKSKKIEDKINNDLTSVQQLLDNLPNKITDNEKKKLTKYVNSLSLRFKIYDSDIDKLEFKFNEFLSKTEDFIVSSNTTNTNNLYLSSKEHQIELQKLIDNLIEKNNLFGNLIDELKIRTDIDEERDKLRGMVTEIVKYNIKDLSTEIDNKLINDGKGKFDEINKCINNKCELINKKVDNSEFKTEKIIYELSKQISRLEQMVNSMEETINRKMKYFEDSTTMLHKKIDTSREQTFHKINLLGNDLFKNDNIKKYY
jgi:hypothetical protein